MKTKAKKRNPQDATLRNTRAQKALIAALQAQVDQLNVVVASLLNRVEAIETAIAPPPPDEFPDGVA